MSDRRPNVILVLTDDQGYGDLGCTGNPYIHTPEIDKFHDESVRFTDYHVAPLCAPTRGALMTGRRPLRNGVWATCWGRSILHEGETTIAELFKKSGYVTGLFGKWHLGDNYPYRPQDRGFMEVLAHKGGGVGQTPDFWGNNYFDDVYFENGTPKQCDGYCTDVWFNAAERFIADNLDKPFFTCITTNAPHDPYLVSEKYSAPYKNNPDIVHPEFYGMISNIDENFGQLRRKLKDWGIENNTILMFMTDNGSSGCSELDSDEHVIRGYNAGMRGMKTSYYDGGHRVPFFIRWPEGNLFGGKDIDYTSFHVDFLPTLCDLCGVSTDGLKLDGISLKNALYGGELPAGRTEFMQYHQSTIVPDKWTSSVVSDKWRLVWGKELYNIETDPGQKCDVSAQYPEIVQRLRAAHESYWQDMQDTMGVFSPIYLGDEHENPTRLNAMDVMGDVAWSQLSIVLAMKSAGCWHVKFVEPGMYSFKLRRWPAETSLRNNELPSVEEARQLAMYDTARDYWRDNGYPNPMNIRKAGLKFYDQEWITETSPDSAETEFVVRVDKAGETDLSAWFVDDTDEQFGAYYVYVERKSVEGL